MKVAIDCALIENKTRVEFQSDNKTLINIMKGCEDNITRNAVGMHCREMWKMKVKFDHIRREKNKKTHALDRAKVSKSLKYKVVEDNPNQSNGPNARL